MTHLHLQSEPDFQERYGVLLDIGRILTGTLQPDELYRTIYEQASRVLETTGFYISLYDAERDEAMVVFYADRGEIERPDITYRGSDSRAIREARPLMEELSEPGQAVMFLGDESDEVTRSLIAAPMLHKGQVIGVISAQSYRGSAYTTADLELIEAIADLAGVAVSNARSMAELDRQMRESQQLEEIGRALSSSLDLYQVLQRIVDASRTLIEADGSSVWLLLPDGQAQIAMTSGEIGLPAGTTIPIGEDLRQQFAERREPLVIDREGAAAILPPDIMAGFTAESALAVPLLAENDLIGALAVSHLTARAYPRRDIRLLQRLAFHAAVAVANARLHEQVHVLSLTDPLTGLPNRRHMDIFLEKEFAAAERGRALTVVLFDLDDFKLYNDTAGHQAGDDVLRSFARIMAGETRAMDLVARYGGDEFVTILSDTHADQAAIWVDRVLDVVRQHDAMSGVGASAGVAGFAASMNGPADIVRAADEALYRAKAERERRRPKR